MVCCKSGLACPDCGALSSRIALHSPECLCCLRRSCCLRAPALELMAWSCPCAGEKGVAPGNSSEGAGQRFHFKGKAFYRILDRFIDQTGAGTDSVYGGMFKDDPGGLKLTHDRKVSSRWPLCAAHHQITAPAVAGATGGAARCHHDVQQGSAWFCACCSSCRTLTPHCLCCPAGPAVHGQHGPRHQHVTLQHHDGASTTPQWTLHVSDTARQVAAGLLP
jgi:hypothetical protein